MKIACNEVRISLWSVVLLLLAVSSVAQPVTRIAAGSAHTLFLKGDGTLWAMGENYFGQLGDGTNNNTNRPEMIVASNVTAIAGGQYHSLFLKRDGSLWAMGLNNDGQLGDGTFSNTNRPEMIVASNVIAIAAGFNYSLFLKSNGSLWAMGLNNDGQLGDGTFNNTNQPELVVASNVTAIAAGGYHSLFITSNGSLWAMGLLSAPGEGAPYWDTNQPEMIATSNVTAIAAGLYHTLIRKSDGSLWAMGDNNYGQLGDGTSDNGNYATNDPEQIEASNITAIVAGAYHSLFLKRDGSLWAMGDNTYGQLGDGTSDSGNYYTNLAEMIVAGDVTAIAGGYGFSLFLKSDGSLWAMGENGSGQLGDGTYNNSTQPKLIVAGPPGYNQISIRILSGGNVSLSFVGVAGTNYELDRSFVLSTGHWTPQATNCAGTGGVLVFTNTPNANADNFWRIRPVP